MFFFYHSCRVCIYLHCCVLILLHILLAVVDILLCYDKNVINSLPLCPSGAQAGGGG